MDKLNVKNMQNLIYLSVFLAVVALVLGSLGTVAYHDMSHNEDEDQTMGSLTVKENATFRKDIDVQGKLTAYDTNGVAHTLQKTTRYYLEEYFNHLPKINGYLTGSTTIDLGSIGDGNEQAVDVTVTGAALGDFVLATFSLDVTDLTVTGTVTAANTVTVIVGNFTGGDIDLGSGDITAKVLPAATIHLASNPNFEVLGTNMTSALATRSSTVAGVTLTTAGADNDQAILAPHLDVGQTAWTGVKWGTENQTEWECLLRTESSIADMAFWSGLKLTNTGAYATDANQIYFLYASNDDLGALTTNANLHVVYSVGGTDYISDLGIAVAASTNYHLKIEFDSSRRASVFVNGVQYSLTSATTAGGVATGAGSTKSLALTNDIDLIPYVATQGLTGSAKAITVSYTAINRLIFE